jgi:hypothetical protein
MTVIGAGAGVGSGTTLVRAHAALVSRMIAAADDRGENSTADRSVKDMLNDI